MFAPVRRTHQRANFVCEISPAASFGILAIAANAQTLSRPGDVDLSSVFSRGLQPLLVGVLVLGIGVSLGGPTGYAINPARDLAPRLAHALLPIPGKGASDWGYSWIPVVAPIAGGIVGAGCIPSGRSGAVPVLPPQCGKTVKWHLASPSCGSQMNFAVASALGEESDEFSVLPPSGGMTDELARGFRLQAEGQVEGRGFTASADSGGLMRRYVGAVDQGTTSTRFMVFDREGREITPHQVEHDQILPRPGWGEHDPLQIVSRTNESIAGALRAGSLRAPDLAAIGVTNQRETTVVWNPKTGRPWYNAIVWQDTRTD